jgi:hypothetical protein
VGVHSRVTIACNSSSNWNSLRSSAAGDLPSHVNDSVMRVGVLDSRTTLMSSEPRLTTTAIVPEIEPASSIPLWARSCSSTLVKHAVSIRSSEAMTTRPYVTGSQATSSGMTAAAAITRQHFTASCARVPPSLVENKWSNLLNS